jgi:hypothetical protein
MSGGSLGNFWLKLHYFGDQVRSAIGDREVDPHAAAAITRIIERVEAISQDVKMVEYWIDGDITSADLVRLEVRYGGQDQTRPSLASEERVMGTTPPG